MDRHPLRVRKTGPLKRLGYALIAMALILLLLLSSFPGLHLPSVPTYCFILVLAGTVLIVIHRAMWTVQYLQLRDRTAYCLKCGWYGKGRDIFSIECCPDCEAENDIRLLTQ